MIIGIRDLLHVRAAELRAAPTRDLGFKAPIICVVVGTAPTRLSTKSTALKGEFIFGTSTKRKGDMKSPL